MNLKMILACALFVLSSLAAFGQTSVTNSYTSGGNVYTNTTRYDAAGNTAATSNSINYTDGSSYSLSVTYNNPDGPYTGYTQTEVNYDAGTGTTIQTNASVDAYGDDTNVFSSTTIDNGDGTETTYIYVNGDYAGSVTTQGKSDDVDEDFSNTSTEED